LLLCAVAPGCLIIADDDGPILSVELYWDARPDDSDKFVGGTCREAGVENMEWKLIKHEDGKDEVVAMRDEPCANAIDVIEPDWGEYTLEVTGRDESDEALWNVECSGLRVLRFDVGYECDIEAP
jgi:hypothetical protein